MGVAYLTVPDLILVLVHRPIPPPRHLPLECNTSTYIYPTNFPKREYQYEIVKSCFTQNTLVALPTGLGKTFIAGTVLLNCEFMSDMKSPIETDV